MWMGSTGITAGRFSIPANGYQASPADKLGGRCVTVDPVQPFTIIAHSGN